MILLSKRFMVIVLPAMLFAGITLAQTLPTHPAKNDAQKEQAPLTKDVGTSTTATASPDTSSKESPLPMQQHPSQPEENSSPQPQIEDPASSAEIVPPPDEPVDVTADTPKEPSGQNPSANTMPAPSAQNDPPPLTPPTPQPSAVTEKPTEPTKQPTPTVPPSPQQQEKPNPQEPPPSHDLSTPPDTPQEQSPPTTLRLNEILANPLGPDKHKEFIELYNDGDDAVPLDGWRICDKKNNAPPHCKDIVQTPHALAPHGYYVLYDSVSINNANEEISLMTPRGEIIDAFAYATSHEGRSWNVADTWYEETPTPGAKNNDNPATKTYPPIFLTELYPNPSDATTADEFIELFNPHDTPVSLVGWRLSDASKSGTYTIHDAVSIAPHSYYVVDKDVFGFALNNTGDETVTLTAPNDTIIDRITYHGSTKGSSYAKNDTLWQWTPVRTPGAKNVFLTDKSYPPLLLSEIMPNPTGDEETQEYIELYNPTKNPIALRFWKLSDRSPSGIYTFDDDTTIAPMSYYTLYRPTFGFALNNTGTETLTLTAPNGVIKSTLSYTKAREGVSYGWTGEKWRWSATPTPQAPNVFGAELVITKLVADNAYKNVSASYKVFASLDDDTLKYRWDFGDGHHSYKQKTHHTYKKTGTYHGTITLHNAIESITQDFTVVVTRYPHEDIKIIAIAPNPVGKDRGNEYITLSNHAGKTINLKGWSIATGKDRDHLVNHPIRKKYKLKKKKRRKIRSRTVAISLPNRGGIVELRAPDGHVIAHKKYNYNDGAPIPAGSVYIKTTGGWQWQIPPQKRKKKKTSYLSSYERNAIISQALLNDLHSKQPAIRPPETPTTRPTVTIKEPSLLEKLLQKANAVLVTVLPQQRTPAPHNSHQNHVRIPLAYPSQALLCDTSLFPVRATVDFFCSKR